jgi:hypothetical protein
LVEVDDLVVAVQCLTTPEEQPELHHWLTHPATGMSAEQVVDKQIAFAEALRPAISAVIANHLETKTPVIIEGDYVLPDLVGPGVSAVFLHEPEEEQLVRNYLLREPGPGAAGPCRGKRPVRRLPDPADARARGPGDRAAPVVHRARPPLRRTGALSARQAGFRCGPNGKPTT